MANAKSVTVNFTHARDHKKVKRFNATSDEAAVSSLYVDKEALKKMGDPKKLTVTVTAS